MVAVKDHVVETNAVHGRTSTPKLARWLVAKHTARVAAATTHPKEFVMPLVTAKALVHFSLPANDVEESLKFYTEVLGMTFRGKVGATGRCVVAGDTNIILVGRPKPRPVEEIEEFNTQLCHQAFQVSSEDYDAALESFKEHGVEIANE